MTAAELVHQALEHVETALGYEADDGAAAIDLLLAARSLRDAEALLSPPALAVDAVIAILPDASNVVAFPGYSVKV